MLVTCALLEIFHSIVKRVSWWIDQFVSFDGKTDVSKKYVKVFVHESPPNVLIVAAIIIQIFMHDNYRVYLNFLNFDIIDIITAAWLAHVDERRTAVREVGLQDPGRTHTQDLKMTEKNALPLLWHLQAVRHSSLLR